MSYATHVSTRQTPQSEPIPGKQQVENSAGGFSFAVDCWTRLDRFLILGNEGGSYYATERKLTQENAGAILECAAQDGLRTVNRIVEISEAGRAPKNDPSIFALALLAGQKSTYSSAALESMPRVCRIGTHLFQFVDSLQHFRGWGRGVRRAVARWYTSKPPADLAYQVTKYQQRGNWSHHDLLHKCHAKPPSDEYNAIFGYIKDDNELSKGTPLPEVIRAVEDAKYIDDAKKMAAHIRKTNLVRECIPTQFLNSPEVWEALLENMPMTAMLRNLGKMSAVGLLKPMSAACKTVCERLGDVDRLKKARIHPLAVLIAHSIYAAGRGFKGSLTWLPDSSIVDALDSAFYAAFAAVEPTGKRYYLGLDVSGSMGSGNIAGTFLTPRVASAAMAMVTVQAELQTYSAGFTTGRGGWNSATMSEIALSKRLRLNEAMRTIASLPMGGTDCALPMLDALENGIEADVFVIYTDSETWAGNIHPCQALQRYRDKTGIPAKLIVCGMVSNGFTIADPSDAGMLDVVGFDASVPQVMSEFARA